MARQPMGRQRGMAAIGIHASHEQIAPSELLAAMRELDAEAQAHRPAPHDQHRCLDHRKPFPRVPGRSSAARSMRCPPFHTASIACQAATLRADDPSVTLLRDVDLDRLSAFRNKLDQVDHDRAVHVITENARVLDAVAALEADDHAALGELMAGSQASMRSSMPKSWSISALL